MGREVRRVPADWKHPQYEDGRGYQPKYDEDFEAAAKRWREEFAAWYPDRAKERDCEFWELDSPPNREHYRPAWPEESRTHYQMYETTSEGTPISPPMESPESLARWLVDNKASAFAGDTATYEQWLRVAKGGWAPSAVGIPGQGLVSGVAALENEVEVPGDAR